LAGERASFTDAKLGDAVVATRPAVSEKAIAVPAISREVDFVRDRMGPRSEGVIVLPFWL
jgi:hypothetical protein